VYVCEYDDGLEYVDVVTHGSYLVYIVIPENGEREKERERDDAFQ